MVYVRRIIEISFVAIAARTYTTATTVGYIMSWKFPTSFPVLVFVVLLPKADVLAESVVADDADDEEKEEEEDTQKLQNTSECSKIAAKVQTSDSRMHS